jgi:hypothetical protein
MDVIKMLESTEQSLLITEKRDRSDIVVGVPHHAPAGTPTLPCPEHRDSDENAGFIGSVHPEIRKFGRNQGARKI